MVSQYRFFNHESQKTGHRSRRESDDYKANILMRQYNLTKF